MREPGVPEGDSYDWFRRASELLERGDAGASLTLIERVLAEEPPSPAALEIRARALFDAGHYAEAADAFADCLEVSPDDDYAHYGAGMSLWRLQRFPESRDHLAVACVMRPERSDYARALAQVKATIAARVEADLPLVGPLDLDGSEADLQGLGGQAGDSIPATDARSAGEQTSGPQPISDFWRDTPTYETSAASLSEHYDVALLDLDGVVYIGEHAVAGAADGLAAARAGGMALTFVTNNASRPPEVVAEHLTELGVPAQPHEVVTSAQAGAALLADRLRAGSAVLAVGGPGVAQALSAVGLVPIRAQGDPSAGSGVEIAGVLQGFGRDVAWSDLAAATLAVSGGAYWVATNPDVTLPVPGGRAPGNGALIAAVATALGRGPDDVAGKPFPALMRASMERTAAKRALVVGDRLDTDIAGAHGVGVPSLLVFTGVTDIAALLGAEPDERPTYLGADLSALNSAPAPTGESALWPELAPRLEKSSWHVGTAQASVIDGRLEVETGSESWVRAAQCACAAAWAADEPPDISAAVEALEALRRTVGP